MFGGPILTLKAPIIHFLTSLCIKFMNSSCESSDDRNSRSSWSFIWNLTASKVFKVSKRWYASNAYWHFRGFYNNNFKQKRSKNFLTDFILLVHMYTDHGSNKKKQTKQNTHTKELIQHLSWPYIRSLRLLH